MPENGDKQQMESPTAESPEQRVSEEFASMSKIIIVSNRQVSAAQCLVRISGGLDKVDPLIAKIASAPPATPEEKRFVRRH